MNLRNSCLRLRLRRGRPAFASGFGGQARLCFRLRRQARLCFRLRRGRPAFASASAGQARLRLRLRRGRPVEAAEPVELPEPLRTSNFWLLTSNLISSRLPRSRAAATSVASVTSVRPATCLAGAGREDDVLPALVHERHGHGAGLRRNLHRSRRLARGLVDREQLRRRAAGPPVRPVP